jgi:hypothetical protein
VLSEIDISAISRSAAICILIEDGVYHSKRHRFLFGGACEFGDRIGCDARSRCGGRFGIGLMCTSE